jgi:hypothetical protein
MTRPRRSYSAPDRHARPKPSAPTSKLTDNTTEWRRATPSAESDKAFALSRVAQALAATNPDHAERIAQSITVESDKVTALSGVAMATL